MWRRGFRKIYSFCLHLSLHIIQDLHGWALPSSMIFGNTSLIRGFLSRSSQVVKFSEALKDVKLVKMNENRFEYFAARILVSDFFPGRDLESWRVWVVFLFALSNFVITNYFKILQNSNKMIWFKFYKLSFHECCLLK